MLNSEPDLENEETAEGTELSKRATYRAAKAQELKKIYEERLNCYIDADELMDWLEGFSSIARKGEE